MNTKKTAVLEKINDISADLSVLIETMRSAKRERITHLANQLEKINLFSPENTVSHLDNQNATEEQDSNFEENEVIKVPVHNFEVMEIESIKDLRKENKTLENEEQEQEPAFIDNHLIGENVKEENSPIIVEIPEDISNEATLEIKESASLLQENEDTRSLLRGDSHYSEEKEKAKEEEKAADQMAENKEIHQPVQNFLEEERLDKSSSDINVESQEIFQRLQEDIIVDEIDTTPEIVEAILEEYQDIVPLISEGLEQLSNDDTDQENIKSLHRNLHTLKGSMGMLGALRGRNELHKMEEIALELNEGRISANAVSTDLEKRFNHLMTLIEAHQSGNFHYYLPNFEISELQKKLNKSHTEEEKQISSRISTHTEIPKAVQNIDADIEKPEELLILVEEDEDLVDEIELEVMPIFVEESAEIVPKIIKDLSLLKDSKEEVIEELARNIHTLKGNVGMVGALRARKELHKMEAIMGEIQANKIDPKDIVNELEGRFENVQKLIDAFAVGNYTYKIPNYDIELWNKKLNKINVNLINNESVATKAYSQKIKVDAEVINKMIIEVNEAKLLRIGLYNNSNSMNYLLKELEDNIERLTRMFRELELHAETQIQSKRSQIEEKGEDYDPLEFDRFTRLQELTKFFVEGVNDTSDLHELMTKKSAEMETMLAHQERAINEVQETLAKTRLIPFSTYEDKLRRIVKRTQNEVNKDIEFIVNDNGIELDRFILEKLQDPITHILRNSVYHGIESIESRSQQGKADTGHITINVRQDSGRIYISIKDDGAGINIQKVRKKAIEKGLWDEKNEMTNQQAAEIICLPTFSTADKVNEIAGRGVGMDVVRNDVLALGGNFVLNSIEGKGLTVNIQVPTTISTIWALIVSMGSEDVAIPVDLVDKVALYKKEEVESALKKGSINIVTGDGIEKTVDFRSLNSVMGMASESRSNKRYNHVVLLKTENQYMAIYVDEMSSVRELPSRPISKTLSTLPGVIGLTILNNGKAAYVMDVIRARSKIMREHNIAYQDGILMPINIMNADFSDTEEVQENQGTPLILVVDDSLTVRKATARFLDKEGYRYELAKDGQDALEKLATINPNMILLDVEMPRMDGFEFAKHVREHQRHYNVPIIMITSRIAEKHRSNAKQIGVNEYVGKPFKENEMLDLFKKYIN